MGPRPPARDPAAEPVPPNGPAAGDASASGREATARQAGAAAHAIAPELRRVLVIRFGRIGDMLVATPALRAIARAHPLATIDVVTTGAGVATLAGIPYLHRVLELRSRRVPTFLSPERRRLVRTLRAEAYDAVFLLEGAERYRRLAADVGAPVVYTFARDDEPATTTRARRAPDLHEGRRFLDVLALAGIPPAGEHYDFHIGDAARERANDLLARAGITPDAPIAGIHAGQYRKRTLRRWPHPKAWPIERFADVIRRLAADGTAVVLTGSADERALNRSILALLPPGSATDLAGRTDLRTLAAVIERCTVFLAPDTGPAHLAAAVGTPLVAMFGPKAPHIMGPLGDDARIVRLYPEPSAALQSERAGYHPRMWAITVQDVLAALRRVAGTGEPER
jgi:ADP-heptose:LPS heptosyltransferase